MITLYKYARDRWGEGPMKLHTAQAVKQKTRYKIVDADRVFDYRTFLALELGHETEANAYGYAFGKLCDRIEMLRKDLEDAERQLDELRALNPTKASKPLPWRARQ